MFYSFYPNYLFITFYFPRKTKQDFVGTIQYNKSYDPLILRKYNRKLGHGRFFFFP